jgi:signal transduction histidine kinase
MVLATVASHGPDGSAADADLVGITRVAAQICGATSAAVNLVRAGGAAAPLLCDVALRDPAPGPMVVPDARVDERFAGHPCVTGERGSVRFYATSRLTGSDGALLGTLCVLDEEVRHLDDRQCAALDDLAGQVVQVLELRAREHDLLDAVGELLRSNDELTAFAGRISHDLRAPLTAVLGFLALVDGPFRDETSERARECVGSALDAARRMRRLVDDLLTYATPDARPVFGPVALPALVGEVRDDLDGEIRRAGAEVSYAGPESVTGDPTLLRQLLQNLVGNAVKHGGAAPRVRVTAAVGDRAWWLQVADDGPGIPPDQRARVFDPFVRLGSARVGAGGSGIGLATCARIADVLGGRIEVRDAPGGGAAFRVTLPGSTS